MPASSWFHVVIGVLVLLVAILTGLLLHLSAVPSDVRIQIDPSVVTQSDLLLGKSTKLLTAQQLQDYHHDGTVFIPRLLSEGEALKLKAAANYAASRQFDVFGLFGNSHYKTVMFDLWRTSPGIASLSLQALPRIAAQIMTSNSSTSSADDDDDENVVSKQPQQRTKSIRLLRDAFFAYSPEKKEGCGWHVDDRGFWPSLEDTTGPTFWIALDPLLIQEGGGLAVLNRTLFRATEPLDLTEKHCRKFIEGATCDMHGKSPECHAKMEASKIQFDMRPGDAMIWDRFTFHRGVGGTELMPQDAIKQRYSVRYMPQGSKAFGAVHSSVDQLAEFDSPYYPQVWPNLLESELRALEHGLDSDVTLISALSYISKRMVKKLYDRVFNAKKDTTN